MGHLWFWGEGVACQLRRLGKVGGESSSAKTDVEVEVF